jgi:hypothetical protein
MTGQLRTEMGFYDYGYPLSWVKEERLKLKWIWETLSIYIYIYAENWKFQKTESLEVEEEDEEEEWVAEVIINVRVYAYK